MKTAVCFQMLNWLHNITWKEAVLSVTDTTTSSTSLVLHEGDGHLNAGSLTMYSESARLKTQLRN